MSINQEGFEQIDPPDDGLDDDERDLIDDIREARADEESDRDRWNPPW